MKALFSNDYTTMDEIVSEHIDVLGPMPTSQYERWEPHGEFFDQDGRPTEREVWAELEQAFEKSVQSYRRQLEIGEFGAEETRAILNLMRQMLTYQPEGRPTIEEVLNSEWMRELVIPDFERARALSTSHSEYFLSFYLGELFCYNIFVRTNPLYQKSRSSFIPLLRNSLQ